MNKKQLEQYKILHSQQEYGVSSLELLPFIWSLIKSINPTSILDYGCGQSRLLDKIKYRKSNIKTYKYDPAIDIYSTLPNRKKVDLILCTDVLEHLIFEDIIELLETVSELSNKVIFSVSLVEANQKLPNGQNAHLTIWSEERWLDLIQCYFPTVQTFQKFDNFFLCKTW